MDDARLMDLYGPSLLMDVKPMQPCHDEPLPTFFFFFYGHEGETIS